MTEIVYFVLGAVFVIHAFLVLVFVPWYGLSTGRFKCAFLGLLFGVGLMVSGALLLNTAINHHGGSERETRHRY